MYILYMDLLFRHYQNKKSKVNNTTSISEIQLYQFDNLLHYIADFSFDYLRYGTKNILTVHHGFTINLKNGDVNTYYQLSNQSPTERARGRNSIKKNNFESVLYLIENGFYKGEKRRGFWGKKYDLMIEEITNIIVSKIKPEINQPVEKDYQKNFSINSLYDLLVDFHLHKKNIKHHDAIYISILKDYPKSKWLKTNENKFLPAVLDSYGIKSKYLIASLNEYQNRNVDIKTLSYLCKLFGEGYVDYLRQINWVELTSNRILFKKYHSLNNEKERACLVNVIKNWGEVSINQIQQYDLLETINKVLTLREFLDSKSIVTRFNVRDLISLELLLNDLENIKNHFKKGYKVRYSYSENFLNDIESDIVIDDKIFKVRVLKSEEDFIKEGYAMKNCLSKQFNKGVVYIYLSMKHNRTNINLEYKKGSLIMSYGKANSPVEPHFNSAISELTKRMLKHSSTTWVKEKYEYITK